MMETGTMNDSKAQGKRKNPIALSMKAIGYLTGPESLPGKAFGAYEKLEFKAKKSETVVPALPRK